MDKVEPEPMSGCWLWSGAHKEDGYGFFNAGDRKTVIPHRWSYEWFVGPIPPGLQIHHKCNTPASVNPHHLAPMTQRENMLASRTLARINKDKAHCKRGHEFTPENTLILDGARRSCRACHLIRSRESKRRGRAGRQYATVEDVAMLVAEIEKLHARIDALAAAGLMSTN